MNNIIIIVGLIVCCISISIGMGIYISKEPKVRDINCSQSEWSECDSVTLTKTRKNIVEQSGDGEKCGQLSGSCVLSPILQVGTLQWQSNCPGDCSGLVWNGTGDKPWGKYYKLSCQNDKNESKKIGPFGPVVNNNYSNPKLRLQSNGQNNGCNLNNTNIYRSTSIDGPYTKLDKSKLGGFNGGVWDGRDAIFVDNDNSTEY
jgi:hypothetical protein